jgi:endonuclease G
MASEAMGRPHAEAFIIPQTVKSTEDYHRYQVPVDEVEAETGLDFMSELPDEVERKVEGRLEGVRKGQAAGK